MTTSQFTATPNQRKASDPAHSVWVGAHAGSGKTHVLVDRVIRLMLDGAKPASILCLTFTKAAAAEMATRLYDRLAGWIMLSDEDLALRLRALGVHTITDYMLRQARQLFTLALETPGGLKIQTIHAFCERLLQLFPVEAGIAPGFRVMDARQTRELLARAQALVLQTAEFAEGNDLSAALEIVVRHAGQDEFQTLLRQAMSTTTGLGKILAVPGTVAALEIVLRQALNLDFDATPQSIRDEIAAYDKAAYMAAAEALQGSDLKNAIVARNALLALVSCEDPEQALELLRGWMMTGDHTPRKNLISKTVIKEAAAAAGFLLAEQQRVVTLIEVHDLHVRVAATAALLNLAEAILTTFEQEKRRAGLYDFEDLITRTQSLLTGTRQAEWVLYKLDAGLQHVLVDEAQDTSPVQWDIIRALVAEFFAGAGQPTAQARSLFVVGDRKQSIYSFQGADVDSFSAAQTELAGRIATGNRVLAEVDLTISYRTTEAVLDVINQVFKSGNKARDGLDGEIARDFTHSTERTGQPGMFQFWPLIVPEEKETIDHWLLPVDRESARSPRRRLAQKIARTIKGWIGRRIIAAENRPVAAGDILILMQSRSTLFGALVSELRKEGVPVAGADRLKLLDSLAVQDLMALAQFILLPEDDHGLACVLKSPLVPRPLGEDQLMQLAFERQNFSLWSRMLASADPDVQQNAQWLGRLQDNAVGMRPYDFFAVVLQSQRTAMLARLGTEALDASNALLELALSYEQDHGASLAGFLHWFEASETEIKREMEQDSGEVRLMTVHGAKGLEANIVILADAVDVPKGRSGASLLRGVEPATATPVMIWNLPHLALSTIIEEWKDLDKLKAQQERNRLLYVAMTRARNELYVCGASGKNKPSEDCWYEMVRAALEHCRHEPGWQTIADADGPGEIWHFGAKMEIRPAQLQEPELAEELPDWVKPFQAMVDKAPRTPSGHSLRNPAQSEEQRRGTAIHQLLQDLPTLAPERRLAFALRKGARTGLDAEGAEKLVDLVNRADLKPFFGPGSQAEVEFEARLPSGGTVHGRVDRLAILDREILVLDYKSDRQRSAQLESDHPYVVQLAAYCAALRLAYPGFAVRAALLWTSHAELTWLDDALLRSAAPHSP